MAFLIGAAVLIPLILVLAAVAFEKTLPLLFAHQRMVWMAIAALQLLTVGVELWQKQLGPFLWLAVVNCVLSAAMIVRMSTRPASSE